MRQVLNEADRIPHKHLFTLQPCVTRNLFQEMKVLEPRALNARYVMLHNGLSGTLFKLKGAGPRFMSRETLQKKGFENLEHEYYMTYSFDTGQSQDYTYIPGLERGRSTYKPWFATWEELMH